MQWLNELPFAENRVLQIGFLAACGIAALIVLAILYRLTFAHRLRVPGGRTRQPRLGLVDAFSLDGQRQLVLVRRDNIEHLVMIGGPNDVLVESQINRAVTPAREISQVSPLLVPAAPVRRTEAAARSLRQRLPNRWQRSPPSPLRRPLHPRLQLRRPRRQRRLQLGRPRPLRSPRPRSPRRLLPSSRRLQSLPSPRLPPKRPRQSRRVSPPLRRRRRPRAGAGPHRRPKRLSRPTSARKFAGASGGAASRTTACDDAPADHPRERLAEPWDPGSRHGNGSHERLWSILRPRLLSRLRRRGGRRKRTPQSLAQKRSCRPQRLRPSRPRRQQRPLAPRPAQPRRKPGPRRRRQRRRRCVRLGAKNGRSPCARGQDGQKNGKLSPKVDDPFADLDSLEAEMARLLGREKSD